MRTINRLLLVVILFFNCLFISSCWNYREIEQMAIVMGIAIDKVKEGEYLITVEIENPTGGQGVTKMEAVTAESSGDTIFHAVRHLISSTGRRLYWSHSKVVIVSNEIAASDMISILDWVSRDQETRSDMWILVSEEATAGEIFKNKPKLEESISMQIDAVCRSQKTLPSFPSIKLYEFVDQMASTAISPILPSVKITKKGNEPEVDVLNTVLFKGPKKIGYLGHDDSEALQFVRNTIKGGLYEVHHVGDEKTNVTLEIFNNKTKINPIEVNGKLIMKIDIKAMVTIAEISTTKDVMSKEGQELLKEMANKQLANEINSLIEKVKKEYKIDIFGFGKKVKEKEPKVWKQVEPKWEKVFADIETQVKVDFVIKGSATLKKPLKVAD